MSGLGQCIGIQAFGAPHLAGWMLRNLDDRGWGNQSAAGVISGKIL